MSECTGTFRNGWRGGPGVCGGGSREEHAGPARSWLGTLVAAMRAARGGEDPVLVEVGCGDLVWHGPDGPPVRGEDVDGAVEPRYHGVDLHRRPSWETWERRGWGEFREGNAAEVPIPTGHLVVARCVFIHLSLDQIRAVLENVRSSGSPLLLATTRPGANNLRRDAAELGDYHCEGLPVDLAGAPFHLREIDRRAGLGLYEL